MSEDNDFIFRQVGRSATLDLLERLESVRLLLREDNWHSRAEVITDAIAEISKLRAPPADAGQCARLADPLPSEDLTPYQIGWNNGYDAALSPDTGQLREALEKLQEIIDLDSRGRYGRLAREAFDAIAIASVTRPHGGGDANG